VVDYDLARTFSLSLYRVYLISGRLWNGLRSSQRCLLRVLIIVSRTEPARYTYLKHVYTSTVLDVILDRRVGGRRMRQEPVAVDRRQGDRRQRDLAKDLKTTGWAVVRH
jgi:hypothetical protein